MRSSRAARGGAAVCKKKIEEPNGFDEPVPTERESMSLCLDFRTLGGTGVRDHVLHEGHMYMKVLYVEFAKSARATNFSTDAFVPLELPFFDYRDFSV